MSFKQPNYQKTKVSFMRAANQNSANLKIKLSGLSEWLQRVCRCLTVNAINEIVLPNNAI